MKEHHGHWKYAVNQNVQLFTVVFPIALSTNVTWFKLLSCIMQYICTQFIQSFISSRISSNPFFATCPTIHYSPKRVNTIGNCSMHSLCQGRGSSVWLVAAGFHSNQIGGSLDCWLETKMNSLNNWNHVWLQLGCNENLNAHWLFAEKIEDPCLCLWPQYHYCLDMFGF